MGHLEQERKEVLAMLELYATQLDHAVSVLVSFYFNNLVMKAITLKYTYLYELRINNMIKFIFFQRLVLSEEAKSFRALMLIVE